MFIEDFVLPFEGKLNASNRWVKLANLIPWEQIEKDYADLFPSHTGTVAKPLRMALGSLIIKERCGFTDRETVEQITENPYLQYFIGLEKYQLEPPFDPSLMVFFRKRLDREIIKKINEMICQKKKPKGPIGKKPKDKDPGTPQGQLKENEGKILPDTAATCAAADEPKEPTDQDPGTPPDGSNAFEVWKPEEHKGKLLLDATCAPADIKYPTDLSLLNEAREKTEKIIDPCTTRISDWPRNPAPTGSSPGVTT
jgi:hypothetical protein